MHRASSRTPIPICRSITGDGVPPHARDDPGAHPARDPRGPDRHAGLRLDGAAGVEHPRRLDQGPRRPARSSTSRSRNLHVVNYSVPVHEQAAAGGAAAAPVHPAGPAGPDPLPHLLLQGDLGLLPAPPPAWSSCRRASTRSASTRRWQDGSLTYGECLLPGESEREVLSLVPRLPSVALQRQPVGHRGDDRAGPRAPGPAAAALLLPLPLHPGDDRLDHLAGPQRGAARRIAHGLVVAYLGDAGTFHYKQSRRGNAEIDRAVLARARSTRASRSSVEDFVPFGYDERQYCSPGFNLPVGSLTRTPYGRYPEYHTSADNLDFVDARRAGRLAPHLPRGGRRARGEPHAT